jgi:hypothetical protein
MPERLPLLNAVRRGAWPRQLRLLLLGRRWPLLHCWLSAPSKCLLWLGLLLRCWLHRPLRCCRLRLRC